MELEAYLARSQTSGSSPGVLLLHGFPSGSVDAEHVGKDLQELADRVATEMDWTALAVRFRGCGSSTGHFDLTRWLDDATASLEHLRTVAKPDRVWIVGFGTGGAVGLTIAALEPEVRGVAVVATPADFDDWAQAPDRLLAHAREVGAIKSGTFPENIRKWKAGLSEVRASAAAEAFAPRPLLVLHGSDDLAVPQLDARMVADAHGTAELRIISGAGHLLRHDPRAIAVLLGWLERARNS